MLSAVTQLIWFFRLLRPHVRWTVNREELRMARERGRVMMRKFVPVAIGLGTLQLNTFIDTALATFPIWFQTDKKGIEPPRVVCISTTTPAIPYALRIAECVKSIAPDAFVMFGGPHEDAIHRVAKPGAKRYGFIDASVAGDGEYILHAIIAQGRCNGAVHTR